MLALGQVGTLYPAILEEGRKCALCSCSMTHNACKAWDLQKQGVSVETILQIHKCPSHTLICSASGNGLLRGSDSQELEGIKLVIQWIWNEPGFLNLTFTSLTKPSSWASWMLRSRTPSQGSEPNVGWESPVTVWKALLSKGKPPGALACRTWCFISSNVTLQAFSLVNISGWPDYNCRISSNINYAACTVGESSHQQ